MKKEGQSRFTKQQNIYIFNNLKHLWILFLKIPIVSEWNHMENNSMLLKRLWTKVQHGDFEAWDQLEASDTHIFSSDLSPQSQIHIFYLTSTSVFLIEIVGSTCQN